MKKFIKNITNEEGFVPVELSYRENGKLISIKPGEKIETKLNGENIGNCVKLILVTDKDEKKKKEVT